MGMLGLKHLLFASEIEPEGTERLLQHLANTGSEDGASGAEPEQGERKETQTLFELLSKPLLKPSSLTFQLPMPILPLCAEASLK